MLMRNAVLFLGAIVLSSACAVDTADGEFTAQVEEAMEQSPGTTNVDGEACCAKDYRDGGGEVFVCGKRDGGWCCNDEGTKCGSCSWYECEPPPAPSKSVRISLPGGYINMSP